MSTANPDEVPESINYIGFNQDAKIISVGHKEGYMFYKTSDILENSTLTCEGQSLNHLGLNNCLIIERLFSSALMVVISQKDPRVLHVYHFTSKNIICDHRFNKSILTVRLNRERIVVCLEDCIYIYNLKDMKMMHNIMDTPMNKLGVLDLTSNPGHALIAYPGSTDTGSVHLFDAMNLSSVNTFVAHEGTLASLKFNQEGNMIATASTKGTVIRVYSVPTGNRLFEFRRGVSRCVSIYSLCFSSDSKYLASSSNTETIHVFKLEKPDGEEKPEASNEGGSWFDTINKTFSAYMPSQVLQVSELMTTERSFATAKLPGLTRTNQVSLVGHKNQQYVMAATSDGFVYAYRLDPEGGELDLIKQHRIGPKSESCRISPVGTTGKSADSNQTVPNMDDPDDFPPMSHTSG